VSTRRGTVAGLTIPLVERIERALVLAAQIVLQHGPVYAPYIDRLEMELEKARRNDPAERAKRILERYTVEGDANAMRLSQSRLCSNDGPTPLRGRDHLWPIRQAMILSGASTAVSRSSKVCRSE
jgi:hypothetical protein